MDTTLRVVGGRGGDTCRVLPAPRAGTVDTQHTVSGLLREMSTSEGERLARLEGKLEAYDSQYAKVSTALDALRDQVQTVITLQERVTSLTQRVENMQTFEAEMELRLRALESDTGINTHAVGVWEKFVIPVVSSLVSGLVVAAAVLQVSGGG